MDNKTQIVVLGSRETGAPAATRLIASMGAYADREGTGDESRPDRPRVSWEHPRVGTLNEEILATLGRSWSDCGELTLGSILDADIRKFRSAARIIVDSLDAHTPWVIHEPLMCLLLDVWKPLLPRAVYVLVHRSPAVAAQSLSLRHGLPLGSCVALWEHYTLTALAATSTLPRVLVGYEDILRDQFRAAVTLHRALRKLGLYGLEVPPAATLRALGDPGIGDAPLSRRQAALADALRTGSALTDSRYRTELAVADPQGQPSPGTQLQPSQQTSEQSRAPAMLEVKLLRARERVQQLHAEVTELRKESRLRQRPKENGRARGVFIIGCPRSGTSVFSWALAQHPKFWTSAESDYLLELFGQGRLHAAYKQAHERADRGWLEKHNIGFSEFAEKLGLGAEALYDSRSGGARWVDATPGYTLMTGELLKLFPTATVLHILRDGREVVNSMVASGFETEWATDFSAACRAWAHYAMLGHQAAQAHPERVLEVRHDRLVADPDAELARVFAFLGEKPSNRSVELIARGRINSSYGNVEPGDIKLPKSPASSPRRPWESWSPSQARTFAKFAGEAMSILGYRFDPS